MKKSISLIVTFIFALAIISNVVAFALLMKFDYSAYDKESNSRYSYLASMQLLAYRGSLLNSKIKEQYERSNLQKVSQKDIDNILEHAKITARDTNDLGTSMVLYYKSSNYLYTISKDGTQKALYKDLEYTPYSYVKAYLLVGFVLFSFIVAYIFILIKLYPLKSLKRQIDKLAQNKLEDIKNLAWGNDEISEVSQAFYEASMKINKLNASRKLFLRNIMHELKTPITKGRITLEMIDDSKYKLRLRECFLRLETLINEFASIEQITSGFGLANITCSSIENVLEEAKDKSMCNDENIEIDFVDSYYVKVDFKLFATAIKNMIDNAIKYSPNHHIKIVVKKTHIDFLNCGNGLDKGLEYYKQAFMRNDTQNVKEHSFGLGLYIVSAILKEHKLGLKYEYINNVNRFIFTDIKNIICDNNFHSKSECGVGC